MCWIYGWKNYTQDQNDVDLLNIIYAPFCWNLTSSGMFACIALLNASDKQILVA